MINFFTQLKDLSKVKGLQSIVSATAWTAASRVPDFKVGVEYNNAAAKAKVLTNVRSLLSEANVTYLYKNYLFGGNFNVDLRGQKILSNELGLTWSPATGSRFGLLHKGADKKPLELGKFWLYFNHAATSSQVVGTEFAYDWSTKAVAAKLGYSHKFNDSTSGKFKIDHDAKVDAILKHQYNNTVTVSLATGFSLRTIVESQKSKAFPVGLAFDLKF
jgi:Eukaryotic porin